MVRSVSVSGLDSVEIRRILIGFGVISAVEVARPTLADPIPAFAIEGSQPDAQIIEQAGIVASVTVGGQKQYGLTQQIGQAGSAPIYMMAMGMLEAQ